LVLGLYLSTHGLKRKGKKLLGPGVAAVIGVDEGGLMSTVALPGSGSERPGDGDGAHERGERREGRVLHHQGENERELLQDGGKK
jgi:hypothetical protein